MTAKPPARISAPEAMTPRQKAAADALLQSRGHLRGPLGSWLHAPELALAAGELGDVVRFRSDIPEDLKEVAILTTAVFWNADHARRAHVDLARKAGVPVEGVAGILSGIGSGLSGPQAAVYRFTLVLLSDGTVPDAEFAAAAAALPPAQLVELVGTIGYYSLVSMTLNAFRL